MISPRTTAGGVMLRIGVSASLFVVSGFLITKHVEHVQQVRTGNVPLAASVTSLHVQEQRLTSVLETQDIQAAMNDGSMKEIIASSVLPKEDTSTTVIAAVEQMRNVLEASGDIRSMKPITLDASPVAIQDPMPATRVHIEAVVTERGAKEFMALMSTLGTYTVNDVLLEHDRKALIALSDAGSVQSHSAVAAFLALPLTSFALDAPAYMDRLMAVLGAERSRVLLQSIRASEPLASTTTLLAGDIGTALQKAQLWPLPLSVLEQATHTRLDDKWQTIALHVLIYRTEQ